MPAKKKKIGSLIEELLKEYNIPTTRDIEELNKNIDEMKTLLKQICFLFSYGELDLQKNSGRIKKISSAEMVLKIIKDEKTPVNFAHLKEKTGFDDKKLRNLIFRLHSTEKIQRVERGAYIATE